MSSNATKIKKELEVTEVGSFLRELADDFDGRGDVFTADSGGQLQDFYKFELKMKREMTAVSLKLKIELEQPAGETVTGEMVEEAETAKPKYKQLKKEMQATFKTIKKSLAENRMPDETTVQTFMGQAALMVSYPGHGDVYYDAFTQACRRFSEAFQNQNWAGQQSSFNEIDQLKSDCHDRFK